jgi:hypothetical protein
MAFPKAGKLYTHPRISKVVEGGLKRSPENTKLRENCSGALMEKLGHIHCPIPQPFRREWKGLQ